MNRVRIFFAKRPGTLRVALMVAFMAAAGSTGAFAAETGTNLPWEGPLTTLVTSLTIRHLGYRNRGARSDTRVSWRRDGRDNAAPTPGRHRRLPGRLRRSGHDFIYRSERGNCRSSAFGCGSTARPRGCAGINAKRTIRRGGEPSTPSTCLGEKQWKNQNRRSCGPR